MIFPECTRVSGSETTVVIYATFLLTYLYSVQQYYIRVQNVIRVTYDPCQSETSRIGPRTYDASSF